MEPQRREFTIIDVDGVLADLPQFFSRVASALSIPLPAEMLPGSFSDLCSLQCLSKEHAAGLRETWENMVDPWLHLEPLLPSTEDWEYTTPAWQERYGPVLYHCSRFPTKGKDPIQQTREWITKYVGDPSPIVWNEVS